MALRCNFCPTIILRDPVLSTLMFQCPIVGYKPSYAGTVWVSVCWEGRCTLLVVTTAGATSTLSKGDDDDDNDDNDNVDDDNDEGDSACTTTGTTW